VSGFEGEHYVRVIYAHASDDDDRYAAMVPTVRRLVADASAVIDAAAVATNDHVSLRVRCAAGEVAVDHVALETRRATADFSVIVSELRALGYDDPRQKYWVYYDDRSNCGCFGVGNFYRDDSDSIDNLNNAGPGAEPMFAVIFDVPETGAFLHELGHTLGAVQDSAPYSTLAGHCYDGRDVMCYNDGGPRGSLYETTYCTVAGFDCAKNTYCHAYPAPGSYLDTNWQACSRDSRYLVYPPNEPPVIEALACAPSPSHPDETVTCTVRATDAAPRVRYELDWGDGSPLMQLPASGDVASGTALAATHVYTAQADVVVRARATDNGHPPLSSPWAERAHAVLAANLAPVVQIDCTAAPREGEPVTCALTALDEHDVQYTLAWGDGSAAVRLPASGYAAPDAPQSATRTFARGDTFLVNVTALDAGRPPRSSTAQLALAVAEVNTAPALAPLACTTTRPKPDIAVTCTLTASDDSPGVAYELDWGDGAVDRLPSSGYLAPGIARAASHTYTVEATFTLSVRAIDDFDPPLASEARTQKLVVQADQTPPTIVLSDPAAGGIYSGCSKLTLPRQAAPAKTIFLGRGCASASVSDASGIARVEVLRATRVIATDTTAPWQLEFDIPSLETDARFTLRAYDKKNNPAAVAFTAHAFGGEGT
jgi:hypothetical protein